MKKDLDSKSVNQIISQTFFVERIIKTSGDVIIIFRGGNPQIPQTLFVGSSDDYCEFVHNM